MTDEELHRSSLCARKMPLLGIEVRYLELSGTGKKAFENGASKVADTYFNRLLAKP